MATFDWQSILAAGKPAGYISGPIITDKHTEMTPQLQATLDYNKALRYQQSAQRQQEAAQQYGVSTSELRGTPAGYIPKDTSKIKAPPPDPNGFGMVGSAPPTQSQRNTATAPKPAPVNNGTGTVGGSATGTPNAVGPTNPYMPATQPMQQVAQQPMQQPAMTPTPFPMPAAQQSAPTNPYTGPYSNPLGTPTTAGVSNPYMQQMSNAITQTANQNLQRNLLPSIGRSAVAMGGYGDSRQGIAQGIAMGDTQQGITNALAGLYGNAYNTDRSYDLGRIGQDQGFYTAQRGLDLNQQQSNTNQYLQALNAATGLGSQVAGIGGQQMQQSLYPLQQLSNLFNPYTGLNQTNTQQQPGSGGGLAGALGGGLTAAQIYQLLNGG
jgi:hypothetical protein